MLRRGTSLFDTWNNDNGLIAAALTDRGTFSRLTVQDQSDSYALASSYSNSLTIASVYSTALPIDGVGDLGLLEAFEG